MGDENGEEAWHLSRVEVHCEVFWALERNFYQDISSLLPRHILGVCAGGWPGGCLLILGNFQGELRGNTALASSPVYPPLNSHPHPLHLLHIRTSFLLFSSTVELNTPSKPEPTSLGSAFRLLVVGRTGFPNIVRKRGEIFVLCMGSWEEGNPPP